MHNRDKEAMGSNLIQANVIIMIKAVMQDQVYKINKLFAGNIEHRQLQYSLNIMYKKVYVVQRCPW